MSPPLFTRLTPAHLDRLRAIVGADHVLTGAEELVPYSHDETEDLRYPPEAVVRPANAAEISHIMRLASAERIPVTPRAGGTGLSGGALAVHGGICLSLERMNRILEIDTNNLMVVLEPAVITQVLQEEVEKVGLFYPPDPASRGSCQIGGNVAENAGGPRALKYGVTKDYVYGLEAVLPNGEIISTGGKLLKNVTGYNLVQLLVGSEGTLAIVTKIILKLIPYPPHRTTLLAPFDSIDAAARALTDIFRAKIIPCACEFMERDAIQAVEQRLDKKFPHSDAEGMLLIECDGSVKEVVEQEAAKVGEICLAGGARDVFLADTSEKQKEMWAMRRAIGEAVKKISPYKEEDTVVPRARIPDLLRAIKSISTRHNLRTICYGHAGDGNIHANILKEGMSDERWREALPGVCREIFEATVALGGSITGEHGIGLVQREFVPIACSSEEIRLMREVKRVFDPLGILNPGKVLPP